MTYVIVGASSGVGRALATRFAEAGHDLIIVSSDLRDVTAVASDLSIRFGRRVAPVAADVSNLPDYLARLDAAIAATGPIDGVLLPVGVVRDDDGAEVTAATMDWTLRVNFTAVAATVIALLPRLRERPAASIVGFGSISSARGRSRNIIYAASKRALDSFFESVRHACANSGVLVQFYVLGYIDTAMAYGRQTPLPPGSPDALSARVLANIHRDIGIVYHPRVWRWITEALRLLPWSIYKKLSF